jgi:hypothetical protein
VSSLDLPGSLKGGAIRRNSELRELSLAMTQIACKHSFPWPPFVTCQSRSASSQWITNSELWQREEVTDNDVLGVSQRKSCRNPWILGFDHYSLFLKLQ